MPSDITCQFQFSSCLAIEKKLSVLVETVLQVTMTLANFDFSSSPGVLLLLLFFSEKVLATERQTVSVVVTPPSDSGTKSTTAPPKPKVHCRVRRVLCLRIASAGSRKIVFI